MTDDSFSKVFCKTWRTKFDHQQQRHKHRWISQEKQGDPSRNGQRND